MGRNAVNITTIFFYESNVNKTSNLTICCNLDVKIQPGWQNITFFSNTLQIYRVYNKKSFC